MDSCLNDIPILLAYVSMEFKIASQVFGAITKILDKYAKLDDTGKSVILGKTLLYYQSEEVTKIKFAAFVSNYIMTLKL